MSLVTAVIIPVKIFIYIATQISSLLKIFLRKNMVAILHGTAVFKKLDGMGK